jgi:hypothetical protein
MMLTEATYIREFGDMLAPDDVERTNCERAGREGHDACGVHTCCGSPRFRGHVSGCAREGTRRWHMDMPCRGRCDLCTDEAMRRMDERMDEDWD